MIPINKYSSPKRIDAQTIDRDLPEWRGPGPLRGLQDHPLHARARGHAPLQAARHRDRRLRGPAGRGVAPQVRRRVRAASARARLRRAQAAARRALAPQAAGAARAQSDPRAPRQARQTRRDRRQARQDGGLPRQAHRHACHERELQRLRRVQLRFQLERPISPIELLKQSFQWPIFLF